MSKVRPGQRIAVIGAGVSGLVAAAELRRAGHDVHVFEAGPYPGGHTNTIEVEDGPRRLAVDTGFIVFNELNYPNFERMLGELGVPSHPAEMSFSVSDGRGEFEWATRGTRGVFARASSMHSIRGSTVCSSTSPGSIATRAGWSGAARRDRRFRRFLIDGGYSDYFIERLLVPQASAVWSADPEQMWSFPAGFLAEFFDNHRTLRLRGRPSWRTVTGGSRDYVEALIAPFRNRVRLETPVRWVERHLDSVMVRVGGATERFDQVVFAVHSDQALRLLTDPSPAESAVMGDPLPAKRSRPPHGHPAAARPPLGMGELELPPERASRRAHHGHLRHEPPPVVRGRSAIPGHAEPNRGDRSGRR